MCVCVCVCTYLYVAKQISFVLCVDNTTAQSSRVHTLILNHLHSVLCKQIISFSSVLKSSMSTPVMLAVSYCYSCELYIICMSFYFTFNLSSIVTVIVIVCLFLVYYCSFICFIYSNCHSNHCLCVLYCLAYICVLLFENNNNVCFLESNY